jgi:hypothetical protein
MYKLKLSFFWILALGITPVFGQVYSDKVVGKKNTELADSIKASEYPYILPILGDAATKRGFNLPYSAGLGLNYIWQESDIIIENLQVGFNHRPMQDLSEVIRFNSAVSKAGGINFRPDVWLFPFLNIYGIVAKVQPSTTVDFGVYVPDGNGNWNNVINMTSKAEFDATSFGFGVTPTLGIGGGWMALDMNFTWNDIAELEKPAFAFIFGPRFGKSFKLKKPEQNIALWVGGFRLKLNTGTSGSLNLTDVIETDGLQARVDAGQQKVSDSYVSVENWWNGLSSVEQKNPVNVAKYEGANSALERASGFLNNLDEALNDEQQASVQYSLDKRPKDMWNFVIGTQYQHNKHWMLRAELGFLGSRTQVITGLQYRFGL